jgi:hypothetical protein
VSPDGGSNPCDSSQPTRLVPLSDANGWAVAGTVAKFAAFQGSEPGGVDYLCGSCEEFKVGANLTFGQVWDIAVRCPKCKGLSAFPPPPPGQPICPAHSVVIWPFEDKLRKTFEVGKWNVVLSVRAAEGYVRETGSRVLWKAFTGPAGSLTSEFDPRTGLHKNASPTFSYQITADAPALLGVVTHARDLLGSVYDRVMDPEYQRSRAALGDPIHPLVDWVSSTLNVAGKLEGGERPEVSGPLSLLAAVDNLERWSRHPQFERLRSEMHISKQFRHNLAVLDVATFLCDNHNGVTLLAPSGADGSPDLLIGCGSTGRLYVEVKSHDLLDNPKSPLTRESALRLVRNKIRTAKVGPAGQLGKPDGSILALAGVDLRNQDLDALETEADQLLNARMSRKTSVAGVLFLSRTGAGPRAARGLDGVWEIPGGTPIGSALIFRLAKNRSYQGVIHLPES